MHSNSIFGDCVLTSQVMPQIDKRIPTPCVSVVCTFDENAEAGRACPLSTLASLGRSRFRGARAAHGGAFK
jgi:hypothetical protein